MDNKSFAKENYAKIFELLKEHHKWFSESLTLIASENVMSDAVKEAVVSDLMSSYCGRCQANQSQPRERQFY